MATLAKKAKGMPNKDAIGKLIRYLKPYYGKILLGLILAIVAVLCRIFAPLLIKDISQTLLTGLGDTINNIDFATINVLGIGALFLYIGAFIADYALYFIMATITADISSHMREDMTKKINLLPISYFDNRNIGDLLSIISNDIDTIGTTLNQTLSSFIVSIMTILGVVVIMFCLEWRLALVVLCGLPIEILIILLVARKSQKYFVSQQDLLAKVSSEAEENYTAQNIIKVFRAKDRSIKNFDVSNQELRNANNRSQLFSGMNLPLMQMCANIIFSLICLIGGVFAFQIRQEQGSEGVAYIATIVACITYCEQMLQPLTQLAQIMSSFQQTIAASGRFFTFIEAVDQPDESDKTLHLEKVAGNISFEHVKFGYDSSRVIIHDFTEHATSGQKVAIVGPTGAGKTTMVNLLMRFYEINSGDIRIEGVPTKDMNRSYVRSLFGMVLQDTWLFEGSFMENLKFSRPDASDDDVYAACKATHCDTFIRQQSDGYNTILNEECGLSAGQKQLLTIARAMIQNAPMLILDEATSSVDTRTELQIQDAMDQLTKNRTSFVIAHRLSTIKNSDLILVMRDGDVIESGTHDALMAKKGFYSELYNSQFSDKGPQID
jgi:ATP-binding cassette subfamily B protein